MYHRCASDLIGRVLDGYNATVMAFGQTGAGKTYTMTGSSTSYGQRGIIPRAIQQLFREADEKQDYSINIRLLGALSNSGTKVAWPDPLL